MQQLYCLACVLHLTRPCCPGLTRPACREAGELLIASSTSSLESGQAGLFKQFYAISPASAGSQLHAVRSAGGG